MVETQCAEIAAGQFAEDVVAFVGTTVIDFLSLIPNTTTASVGDALLYFPDHVVPAANGEGYAIVNVANEKSANLLIEMVAASPGYSGSSEFNAAYYTRRGCIFRGDCPPPNWTAISNFVTAALALPWSEPITFPIAGLLSFINGTWSLTRLAPLSGATAANFTFATIQYFQVRERFDPTIPTHGERRRCFSPPWVGCVCVSLPPASLTRLPQVGYIFDWFRGGAVALGEVLAFWLLADKYFGDVTFDIRAQAFWGLLWVFIAIPQITLELIVQFTFMNSFYFAASESPFQPITIYCNSNTSQAHLNYLELYNNSASWAIVFGCNESLSPVPISNPEATCSDSVAGGLVLALYRLPVEIVHYVLLEICDSPETLTFKPPLFYSPPSPQIEANPSNPPLLNFANISLNGIARQTINLGNAVQNLFYSFDELLTGYGVPTSGPCQFQDLSSPNGIGYRISFFCITGAILNTIILGAMGAVYEVLLQINRILGGFADSAWFLTVRGSFPIQYPPMVEEERRFSSPWVVSVCVSPSHMVGPPPGLWGHDPRLATAGLPSG